MQNYLEKSFSFNFFYSIYFNFSFLCAIPSIFEENSKISTESQ